MNKFYSVSIVAANALDGKSLIHSSDFRSVEFGRLPKGHDQTKRLFKGLKSVTEAARWVEINLGCAVRLGPQALAIYDGADRVTYQVSSHHTNEELMIQLNLHVIKDIEFSVVVLDKNTALLVCSNFGEIELVPLWNKSGDKDPEVNKSISGILSRFHPATGDPVSSSVEHSFSDKEIEEFVQECYSHQIKELNDRDQLNKANGWPLFRTPVAMTVSLRNIRIIRSVVSVALLETYPNEMIGRIYDTLEESAVKSLNL